MDGKEKVDAKIQQAAAGPGDPPAGSASLTVKPFVPNDDQKHVYLGDMLSNVLATGDSPVTSKNGRAMFQYARDLYGDQAAHNLLDQVILFNSQPQYKNKSKENRIESFYSLIHDPQLEKIKNRLDKIGHGAVAQYYDSPNYDTQQLQGNDLLKDATAKK
jgi:hypothetical protein